MRQRRELAEFQVLIARDVIVAANLGEHFSLLDRVDAEIGLEVQLEVEHVRRIVGLLGDNPDYLRFNVVRRQCCRSSNWFGRRLRWRRSRNCLYRRRRFPNDDGLRCTGYCPRRRSLVPDAQSAPLDLEVGVVVAADAVEPLLPAGAIGDAIIEAELVGVAPTTVGRRHPSSQGHR